MKAHEVDVCLIEDDEQQRKLVQAWLLRHSFSCVTAADGVTGLRRIYDHHPRIIVSDIVLPDIDGIELCTRVRMDPALDGTYIILFTAHDQPGRRKQALLAGADDYLRKPYDFDEMSARLANGMRLHQLQARLRRAAVTDGLTDLWNHSHLRDVLERELLRARRYDSQVALLMIDLDHFKAINDTYGHEIGNAVLRGAAEYLRRSVREVDIVARYGGEEFAVILPETGLDEAARLAERIRVGMPTGVTVPRHPNLLVRCSIGVASSSDPRAQSIGDLIDLADQALYQCKHNGRNQVARCDRLGIETTRDHLASEDDVDRLRKEVVGLSMRMKDLCLQSVSALIEALATRDGHSAWHSHNVSIYTRWLAEAAGWSPQMCIAVGNAARLHDLGRIGLSDDLLAAPGVGSDSDPPEALAEVPRLTCRIIEPLRVFETEIWIIRHMRERWDGRGVPDRLTGERIPPGSRLLAVAEAFDALTCPRGAAPPREIDAALTEISLQAGRKFDPHYTALLVWCVREQRQTWEKQVRAAVRGEHTKFEASAALAES